MENISIDDTTQKTRLQLLVFHGTFVLAEYGASGFSFLSFHVFNYENCCDGTGITR